MTAKELETNFFDYAEKLGCKFKGAPKANSVKRSDIKIYGSNEEEKKTNYYKQRPYFGIVRLEETDSGAYSDFSLVVFPQIDCKYCVLSLTVGSSGFKNDFEYATSPWLRRLFFKLRIKKHETYFKSDFSDIESSSSDMLNRIGKKPEKEGEADYSELYSTIDYYKNFLPASIIIDLQNTEELPEVMKAWIATYATFRGWASNSAQKKEVDKALKGFQAEEHIYTTDEIYGLLKSNRFLVLQGAPGTGKTFTALQIAGKKFKTENVFFEQFHAETTYSDFIYGIKPKLDADNLTYEANEGILYRAIKQAENPNGETVLLIIDEINRANLSNVLGPVFYLFEKETGSRECKLKIGDMEIDELPKNLYVIATMNTADRSLAVVDFALRRRFTWITLKPHALATKDLNGKMFDEECFSKFDEIFQKYASDDELNLQPGQSYFIVSKEEEMKNRIQYELMPLIKEYFNEGFMLKAKDDFSNFFYNNYEMTLYE